MKVTLNRAELLSEAQKCILVVERKASIPILLNFLLEAKGNTLTISGTDLDRSIVMVMPAKVEAEGSLTVPARKLLDILKKVATDEVTIKALENHWVGVTAGPLFVKLVGMDRKSFPSFQPMPADTVSVPGDVLAGLVARTNHAISKEESRYTLNAALVVVQPDSIRMVATDGHRLALVKHAGTFAVTGEFRTLVHEAALDVLVKLAGKSKDMVEIARYDSLLFMRSNNWTFQSRIPTGQFPNYEAVIPKFNGNEALCIAADLKATINRVAMFADERSRGIRFEMSPEKGLILRASSTETGEACERVQQAAYKGDPMTIGFNAQFVLDVLGKLDKTDAIRIHTRDAQSSAMFVPYNNDAFMVQDVVMPMRI